MPTVTELFDGRGVGWSTGGQGNEGIQRRYKRRFRVLLDNREQGELDVYEATGIPRMGDPFVSAGKMDLTARCHELNPESTNEPRLWFMEASYSSDRSDFGDPLKEVPSGPANEPGQKDGKPGDPNSVDNRDEDDPLRQRAKISWTTGHYSEVVQECELVDEAGNIENQFAAVAMSNGELIEPPLEDEIRYQVLTITRNQADFDDEKALEFMGAFNSTVFFGKAIGKVKCQDISADEEHGKNRTYFVVRYVFEIRRSWDHVFLDAGYWEIVGGVRSAITLPNGRPLPAPWPLDGEGVALSVAQMVAGNAFKYRRFRVGERKDFAALNLP